jgi:hypothetical protein
MKPTNTEDKDVMSLRYGINVVQKLVEHWSFLLRKYNDALIDEEPTEMFNDLILSYLEKELTELGIDDFMFDNPNYILGLQHAYTWFSNELLIQMEGTDE